MNEFNKVYICQNKDSSILSQSSSGGAFYAFASHIINEKKGYVYGAGFNENFKVIHKRASTLEEAKEFIGSKYVQSDCIDAYKMVKQDLIDGKYVLFSGTPCQVAGLKKYIGNNNEKLFTIDFICHGVPSPKFFKEYLEFQENHYKDKISKISFRGKKLKNEIQDMYMQFNSGREYKSFGTHDIYYNSFLQNLNLRPSCFNCPYTNKNRNSDLTLSDYWGDKSNLSDFKNSQNISCVFINSEKGEYYFHSVYHQFDIEKSSMSVCDQPNLHKPTRMPNDYHDFWKFYECNGFEKTVKKFFGNYNYICFWRNIKIILNEFGLLYFIKKFRGK